MKKITIIFFLLLLSSSVSIQAEEVAINSLSPINAQTENLTVKSPDSVSVQIEEAATKSSEKPRDIEIALLKNKIEILEQKPTIVDKDLDRILQSSQTIWQSILYAVLAIMAALITGSLFNTFFYVKSKIKKTEESLRNEIACKLREIKDEFEKNVTSRFDKIKKEYDVEFDILTARVFDAVGRIYRKDEPLLSAMWFARCIEIYMNKENFPALDEGLEKWIKFRMDWITEDLQKCRRLFNPEHIKELQEIISKIDKNKFGEQKEKIQKALTDNINKTKESEAA